MYLAQKDVTLESLYFITKILCKPSYNYFYVLQMLEVLN